MYNSKSANRKVGDTGILPTSLPPVLTRAQASLFVILWSSGSGEAPLLVWTPYAILEEEVPQVYLLYLHRFFSSLLLLCTPAMTTSPPDDMGEGSGRHRLVSSTVSCEHGRCPCVFGATQHFDVAVLCSSSACTTAAAEVAKAGQRQLEGLAVMVLTALSPQRWRGGGFNPPTDVDDLSTQLAAYGAAEGEKARDRAAAMDRYGARDVAANNELQCTLAAVLMSSASSSSSPALTVLQSLFTQHIEPLQAYSRLYQHPAEGLSHASSRPFLFLDSFELRRPPALLHVRPRSQRSTTTTGTESPLSYAVDAVHQFCIRHADDVLSLRRNQLPVVSLRISGGYVIICAKSGRAGTAAGPFIFQVAVSRCLSSGVAPARREAMLHWVETAAVLAAGTPWSGDVLKDILQR